MVKGHESDEVSLIVNRLDTLGLDTLRWAGWGVLARRLEVSPTAEIEKDWRPSDGIMIACM